MPFGHIARARELDETAGTMKVLIDPKTEKPTRVRAHTLANGRKVRIAIASGEQMARE